MKTRPDRPKEKTEGGTLAAHETDDEVKGYGEEEGGG